MKLRKRKLLNGNESKVPRITDCQEIDLRELKMSLRYHVYLQQDLSGDINSIHPMGREYYFIVGGKLNKTPSKLFTRLTQKQCYEVCQMLLAEAETKPELRTKIYVEQVCDLNTFEHMFEWVEMEDK